MTISTARLGIVITESEMVRITISTQPPIKPAEKPRTMPMAMPMVAAIKAHAQRTGRAHDDQRQHVAAVALGAQGVIARSAH